MTFLVVGVYLAVTLVIGVFAYRVSENTPDDFFLASRRTGPVVLFFTLIATNFSAFFFLGFAGAGYRIGYSYYPIMAVGTALVALAFYFIGYRAWQLGRVHGYITPPELIGHRLQHRGVQMVYLTVMVLFTVPYLAIQPIGAGYLLEGMTNGAVPYFTGAVGLTVAMVLYVFLGGMRSVALTDVVQGVLMFALTLVAVLVIGHALGGLGAANTRLFEMRPDLFSRTGVDGFFTPRRWFSYMILWVLAVPMFPQMFMRFFISRRAGALKMSAIVYPFVTATLFLGPVLIGVLGHLEFPALQGTDSDQILPLVLKALVPETLGVLVMVGALAAFMSTMDSQLLALSSMMTRDLYVGVLRPGASVRRQVVVGKVLVVALSIAGLAIAYRPPATIFALATEAFTGLAVLFPTTVATLHWRRTSPAACIVSIVTGELLLIGFYYGWVPPALTFGFLPLVPIVTVSTAIVILGSIWWGRDAGSTPVDNEDREMAPRK